MNQKTLTSPSHVQKIFDCIAPEYDQLNDRLSFGQHRIWKLMAVKWSNPQLGDTALDICCGSGDLAFILAKKVGVKGKVTGLDFSSHNLRSQYKSTRVSPHNCLSSGSKEMP